MYLDCENIDIEEGDIIEISFYGGSKEVGKVYLEEGKLKFITQDKIPTRDFVRNVPKTMIKVLYKGKEQN